MKKLFYLLGLTILNSYILHKSCEGNMTHLHFREQLVRGLNVLSHEDTEIHGVQGVGLAVWRLKWADLKQNIPCTGQPMEKSVPNEETKKKVYYCKKCDCGMHVVPCFELWHKTQMWVELTVLVSFSGLGV